MAAVFSSSETLYNVAASTGHDRWASVGDRFQKTSFINPLALRRDELRGLHANTHIPQAIAAARRYEISGDSRFRGVADYFFHEVSGARSYVTGGTSNAEGWLSAPGQLASEWRASADTAVLAGDLGNDGLTAAHIVGPNLRVGAAGVEQHGSPLGPVNRTPPIADIEIPTFRAHGSNLHSWIKAVDQPRTFRTVGQKKDVTLVPLNRLFDRRYSVYWQVY